MGSIVVVLPVGRLQQGGMVGLAGLAVNQEKLLLSKSS
jgi:hypothetical protein